MAPELIQMEPVTDDELDGDRMWLETNSSDMQSKLSLPVKQETEPKKWWQLWK